MGGVNGGRVSGAWMTKKEISIEKEKSKNRGKGGTDTLNKTQRGTREENPTQQVMW